MNPHASPKVKVCSRHLFQTLDSLRSAGVKATIMEPATISMEAATTKYSEAAPVHQPFLIQNGKGLPRKLISG